MESALFDEPNSASTPPYGTNDAGTLMDFENSLPAGEPYPTKSISESESRLLQAVSNKYGIGAISTALAIIILLTLSPSFVTDEDGKFSMQLIFVLAAVVFVVAVWGPPIWVWVKKTWVKDTKQHLSRVMTA